MTDEDKLTYTEVVLRFTKDLHNMDSGINVKLDDIKDDAAKTRERVGRMEAKLDAVCETTNRHEKSIEGLKGRERNITIISTTIATVVSSVAAIFGPQNN